MMIILRDNDIVQLTETSTYTRLNAPTDAELDKSELLLVDDRVVAWLCVPDHACPAPLYGRRRIFQAPRS
jgi:hypothetical protein